MGEKIDYMNSTTYTVNEMNFSLKPYSNYGDETAFWIDAQRILGNKNPLLKNLENKLSSFCSNDFNKLDFSFVKDFLKEDFSGKIPNYFVKKDFGFGWFGDDKVGRTFSDGHYRYLLGSDKKFCTVLSFDCLNDGILIYQIQGFGNLKLLNPIRPYDLLLNFAEKDLVDSSIKKIYVLPYFRNRWPLVRQNHQNTYKRKYDQVAKRNDYIYDEKKGIYVKEL
jgi:hypothetical protein